MGTQTNTSLAKRRVAVRRGVIGGLVVLSIALFSIYFRESGRGPLHGLQDAVGTLAGPVESVADRAVRPLRDAWGWTSDLVGARNRAERLERENAELRAALVENASRDEELARLRALAGVPDELATGYRRVPADVVGRSPTNWYGRARLSVGSPEGVVVNSPVVTSVGRRGALVGYVISVRGGYSVVSFITDPRTRVGARVLGSGNAPAILRSGIGGQLELTNIPRDATITRGATVETAGFAETGRTSIYPPGIPIGQVREFGHLEADVYQRVQVEPLVDVRRLSEVVVLVPQSAEARRRAAGP
jgi:rod shape-determining protein MreC